MDVVFTYSAYGFAILVGLVAAGLIGSAWAMSSGDEPEFGMLFRYELDWLVPLRVVVWTISMPKTLFEKGIDTYVDAPVTSMTVFAVALLWSFLQGVFILTQVFGLP